MTVYENRAVWERGIYTMLRSFDLTTCKSYYSGMITFILSLRVLIWNLKFRPLCVEMILLKYYLKLCNTDLKQRKGENEMNQGQEMFDQFFMERARACLKNAFWYMYPKGMICFTVCTLKGMIWRILPEFRRCTQRAWYSGLHWLNLGNILRKVGSADAGNDFSNTL